MGKGPAVRVAMVLGGLLLFGIVLRLIAAIFQPILPKDLMQAVSDGWHLLFGIVKPAMPAIAAVAILAAICWVVMAWWRRY